MTTYSATLGVIFLIVAGPVTTHANEVGHTPGVFSVGKLGEATYEIPIAIPPGAAGMQPDLGLTYNSNGGNGPLGVGWTISGLSAITRCAATRAQDDHAGAVRYQSGDKFCLDGQRLMNINGTYGAGNSRYHTEIESFQDIHAYDDDSDGRIDKFLVRDKTGMTRYYGYTSSSRIEAQGKSYAQLWMLNRVADKFGNYFEVEYEEQTAANQRGEFWVTNIYYRNSNDQNLGRIEFRFDSARPDAGFGFSYAGSKVSSMARLHRIDVYGHDRNNGWSRARQYQLSYESNPANGSSQLIAVQQCDAAATACLPPTRMQYFHGENGFDTNNFASLPSYISNQFMDVNGDGRPDQVYESSYRWAIRLSGSHDQPYVTTIDSSQQAHQTRYTRVLDHNGDGKQDLLAANITTGRWEVLESTGTGFILRDTGRAHLDAYLRQPMVMDLDGDALPEIVFKDNGWLKFYQNEGGAYSGPINTGLRVTAEQVLTPLEYDGDGQPDIVVNMDGCDAGGPGGPGPPWGQDGKGSGVTRGTSHCSQTAGILTWSPVDHNLVQLPMAGLTDTAGIGGDGNYNQLLDFNGDGLSDLAVAPANESTHWRFYVNKGADWQHVWSGHNGINRDKVTVFDYDGDGRQELWQPSGSSWYRFRPIVNETGVTFSPYPTVPYTGDRIFFMDWTGDGLPDLIIGQGGNYHIRTHKGTKRGLLRSIENGLGNATRIAYVAMSDIGAGVVYEGETGTAAFPDRHFRAPMYLVRSVATDSGLLSPTGSDFKVTTHYTYHGAKLNQHGRGFLGFSKIEAHNVNTEIVTYNTHSQVFPFIGMVTKAEQWTPDVYLRYTDWNDIAGEFEPCRPASGPCMRPRSSTDQTRETKLGQPVARQRNAVVPGEKLSETLNTLETKSFSVGEEGERHWPYISVSTEYQYKYRGPEIVRRTVTNSVFDDYGNAENMIVTVDDGDGGDVHRVSTTNSYRNWSDERWCLGRLMATMVTHQRSDFGAGGPLIDTRESSFEYHSATCQLIQEVIEPDNGQWRLQKNYGHDSFGNRSSATVSGPGIAVRTETTIYDEFGQHPLIQSNPLGHAVRTTWDYTFGHPTTITDVNGLVSQYQYDTLGRKTGEIAPRSTLWTEFDTVWCIGPDCESYNAVFRTLTRSSTVKVGDRIAEIIEYDQLGREVLEMTRAFDGSYIHKETHYDPAGRAYATSTPHYDNELPCWKVNEYDNIGRLAAEYRPAEGQDCINYGDGVPYASSFTAIDNAYGNVTRYDYDGLQTQITDAQGRVVSRVVNVMDRLISVTERDDAGQLLNTRYDYDPAGNIAWVRDANGNVSRMRYNLRGFKISMDDPDLGHWEYSYNTLGELIRQQDAKNQITTMQYDLLGRMTSRSTPEGQTNWYFDDPTFNFDPDHHGASIGRLTRITGSDGYLRVIIYTGPYGELTQRSERLDGVWYYSDFHYDDQGRMFSTVAPAVGYGQSDSTAHRLRLDTAFNAYGYPYLVREYRDQTHQHPLWRAIAMDALGNVIAQQTHNDTVPTSRQYDRASGALLTTTAGVNGVVLNESYQWDSVGNLTARSDLNKGWTERFRYDKFYRLSQVSLATTIDGDGRVTAVNKYDSIGNITCKDATGHSRETCSGGIRNYVYGSGITSATDDAGPHAVTKVSTKAGERSYHYDDNGNLSRVSGRGLAHNTEWYSFNRPKRSDSKKGAVEFWYRPDDRHRWKQVNTEGHQATTTIYVGDLYERRLQTGQPDQHIYYVQAAGRVIAQIKRYGDTISSATEQYLHRDHLGSIAAVSNDSGVVIERMSYDAWGKRRRVDDWTSPGLHGFLDTLETRLGFTGHQHIDSMGLIQMKGRVYDVEIGRFLSADPFVQYPDSTQALNRYTYAQNNPLSYTDPSGFFVKGLIAKMAGTLVTTMTGQPWLGHLVQGYLSSGGDLKAIAIAVILGTYGHNAYPNYQRLASGLQARKNGDRFVNGVLGAMKVQIIGRVDSIGHNYLLETGARITDSLKTAAASGTGPVGDDSGSDTTNGAVSESFDNATKMKFEAYLSVKIRGWLVIGAKSDGRFFANARGRTVSMRLDATGNLTFSVGNVSTQIVVKAKDFTQLAEHVRDSFNIDLSVLGGSFSVTESGNIAWTAHIKTSGWLGKLGIGGRAGFSGIFDPSEQIRKSRIGEAGYQYRRGTTDHVDRCLQADFDLAGC